MIIIVNGIFQILCSPNLSSFKWVKVNDKEFFLQTLNKDLVRGGVEDGNIVNIGRIGFQGQIVTGKVITNSVDYPDTAPMFFAYKDKENKFTEYEVLIYESKDM